MTPYPNLPYSHNGLKAFEAVARLMSFTLAANELNVTQSAVSRQVKQLEDDLGASLVVRKHRAITLTEQGLALSNTLRKNYQAVETLVASWKAPQRKRIVIKAALSYTTRVLMPKVRILNDRYPDYEIVIVPTIDEESSLHSSDYDLLIFSTRLKDRYGKEPGMIFLREEYMAPVCASSLLDDTFNTDSILTLPRLHSTLDHEDWRLWLEKNQAGKASRVRETTFYTLDLALSACLSGQGVTVTDLLLVLPELHEGYLQCPEGTHVEYSAWRYFCHYRQPSPVIDDLLLWLQSETQRDIEILNQLAQRHQWQGVIGS
ncbi:LysR family transcriptional regulator [Vibrio proteolyticus]